MVTLITIQIAIHVYRDKNYDLLTIQKIYCFMCPYRIQKQHLIMNKVERFDFQPFNALINFVMY